MTANFPQTLICQLQSLAMNQPEQRGFTFLTDGINEGATLTYAELDHQSREIAVMLQRILKPGDRVLLMYPAGLEFVSAFFGCLYAGVIAVPAYPPQPARPERSLPRLRSIAKEAGVSAILCTEKTERALSGLFHLAPEFAQVPVLATDHYGLESIEAWKPPNLQPNAIAFLQYTSGSTAAPKGVAVTHHNILHNLACIEQVSDHDVETVLVSWLPTYHDMGLFAGVLFPLFKSCPSYLMAPAEFLQRPIRWLQAISHFRGTNSGGPNFAFGLCVEKTTVEQRRELDLSSWRVAYNGAEPVRRSTLDQFAATFHDCGFERTSLNTVYGLAESTVFVCGKRLSNEEVPLDDRAHAAFTAEDRLAPPLKSVSCGVPQLGMELLIVDPVEMIEVDPGQTGEIWIAGPSVAQGYWNRPDATRHTFQAHLSDSNRGPFLRTGDLGFTRGGELYVTGRRKDLIIIRGRKHYPQDIERTVEACHSAIRANCAAAIPVSTRDGEGVAIVAEINLRRRRDQHGPDGQGSLPLDDEMQNIIATIRQSIALQHEIQTSVISIVARGCIPKTSSGKIQRHACQDVIKSNTAKILAQWTLHSSQGSAPFNDSIAEFA